MGDVGGTPSEHHEVCLTPEDQMVLKYLIKLVLSGMSRDEIAHALDHAFTDLAATELTPLRSLVADEGNLPVVDACLRGGRFEILHLALSEQGDLVRSWRAATTPPRGSLA